MASARLATSLQLVQVTTLLLTRQSHLRKSSSPREMLHAATDQITVKLKILKVANQSSAPLRPERQLGQCKAICRPSPIRPAPVRSPLLQQVRSPPRSRLKSLYPSRMLDKPRHLAQRKLLPHQARRTSLPLLKVPIDFPTRHWPGSLDNSCYEIGQLADRSCFILILVQHM